MPVNVNPSDIVDNLTSMGYRASHFQKDADGDKPGANAVYIDCGTNKVKAYINLAGEAPAFKVWAEYPEGHQTGRGRGEPLHGDALKKFNREEADRVRDDLKAPALAAYQCAAEGGDLRAIFEGFDLGPSHDRYKPRMKTEQDAAPQGPAAAPGSAPGM